MPAAKDVVLATTAAYSAAALAAVSAGRGAARLGGVSLMRSQLDTESKKLHSRAMPVGCSACSAACSARAWPAPSSGSPAWGGGARHRDKRSPRGMHASSA
jgi:hypothetical protein